jgi:hypothetical protein
VRECLINNYSTGKSVLCTIQIKNHMRWKFFNPDDESEAKTRQATLDSIHAWWKAFASRIQTSSDLFHNRVEWDLRGWMHEHLHAINPNLMWEYGPAVNCRGHRLVITPESEHCLRPLVKTIIERAPSFSGWEFYQYRLSSSLNETQKVVMDATGIDISGWHCKAAIDAGNRIKLTYLISSNIKKDDEKTGAAFMTTEWLLGEELLDKWIGTIEVKPMPKSGILKIFSKAETDNSKHIAELNSIVNALIDGVKSMHPANPFYMYGENTTWSAIKLTPSELIDYPGRKDLFVATTGLIDMWKSAHDGMYFSSERFSGNDEVFCYIKIEHTDEFDGMDLEKREEVENSLASVLHPIGAGGICGGGTGVRYCYIDLALLDPEKAIPLIIKTLREARVSQRSWILFFDTELSQEWVGIYEKTPPPP